MIPKSVALQQDVQVLGVTNFLLLLSNILSALMLAGLPKEDLAQRSSYIICLLGSGQLF